MQNKEIDYSQSSLEPKVLSEILVLISNVRLAVRTMYDLQKLRIMTGNRLAGEFRTKLGQTTDGMSEEELNEASRNMLSRLRAAYDRITDAIVAGAGKTPTMAAIEKRFKADDVITQVGEYFFMQSYVDLLKNEESHKDAIERTLMKIPVYRDFLKDAAGVGPAMAGVLISEIDIFKAQHASSIWKLAGLDVATVYQYKDPSSGKLINISETEVQKDGVFDPEYGTVTYDGYLVTPVKVGRNNHSECMVDREYVDKDGNLKTRKSITYSPFLKTKLLGVLGPGFLKASSMRIDGKAMGAMKRLELAKSKGFDEDEAPDDDLNNAVLDYLKDVGFKVERGGSPYAVIYYDYKARLKQHPVHKDKMPIVHHRMALRKAVKAFLIDYYKAAKTGMGLPYSAPYSEAKLGLVHGQMSPGKQAR